MCLDLARLYPHLKFVIQDRAAVIEKARQVWQKELPDFVRENRVQFMIHDFYTEQPVKGAEVYNLRYIMLVPLRLDRAGGTL